MEKNSKNNITITLNSTRPQFFRQWLELMKQAPPLNELRNKELDVLGQIMYSNHMEKEITNPDKRAKIIFDYSNKQKMMNEIGMNNNSFANCITRLRKLNLLRKGNLLHKSLDIHPDKEYNVQFSFKIDNDSAKTS